MAYARALFEVYNFDIVTVNPYQGSDTITPYLILDEYKDKCVYVTATTTNSSSEQLQNAYLEDGGYLWQLIPGMLARSVWQEAYLERIGYVVVPTKYNISSIRQASPNCNLLLPGIGKQGYNSSIALGAAGRDGKAIVTASRSICYDPDPVNVIKRLNS